MGVWIVATIVSWLAGAATAYGLINVPRVAPHVPADWRIVAGVATALHIAASALVYAPLVRALQWRVSRGTTMALTAIAGVLPWAALLAWRGRGVEGALALRDAPEAWICAALFLVSSAAFGLLRYEYDPQIAALEARLSEFEKRASRL